MQELQVVDFGMPHYMRVVELALRAGWPVLLQNVMETLDPSIMPILNKTIVLQGEIIDSIHSDLKEPSFIRNVFFQ